MTLLTIYFMNKLSIKKPRQEIDQEYVQTNFFNHLKTYIK